MGTNFHTAWSAGVTQFTASSMNPALAALDKAVTYATKSPIVHCDGDIAWTSGGTLSWASTMRILYTKENGHTVQNTIATGSIAIADNQFAYVDISETNNAVLTMSVASVTTATASNFLTLARLVMAYRNTASNEIYSVWLPMKYSVITTGHARSHAIDGSSDHTGFTGATADEVVTIASTTLLPKKSGKIITDFLNGIAYDASSAATAVTVNWSNGHTQYMSLATASTRISFSNPSNGKVYRLRLKQDATGNRAVTWGSTIKWRGAAAPTLSTGANKIDIVTVLYIDSAYHADAALNFA